MSFDLDLTDRPAQTEGTSPWGTAPPRRDDLVPTVDLLVVGAGVAGLAVAWTAVRAGVGTVQVVDAGPVGAGASARNAGALIPDVHALTVDADEAALGRRGLALHRAHAPELGHPLRPLSWLAVRDTPPSDPRLAASRARWLSDPAAVEAATGGTVVAPAGVLVPDQAATDPVALMAALAAGVPQLATHVPVTRLQAEGRGVRVETTGGVVHAGVVVLATGTAPSGWLPTRRRWVTGHLAQTAPVPGVPPDLAVGRRAVVVPRGDGRLLVGGTRDGEQVDGRIDDRVVETVRRELGALVPAADGVALEHVWTGQRPVVDDDLPLLDQLDDRVLVVAGLFHTGVLTCLAVAEGVVARLRHGRWPATLAPFHRRAGQD